MSFGYDPEVPAGYQDADIEMAQYEAEGARYAALRRRGICTHGSCQGYPDGPGEHLDAIRAKLDAKGVKPGQVICTEGCETIFESSDDWHEAHCSF